MLSKIQITGYIEVMTGMHIGGSSAFAAIGAVDSPVVKDVITKQPMIPGTSLKGKMRALLAKEYNEEVKAKPDDDHELILRLFGSAKKEKTRRSRLIFSDMFLLNRDELKKKGVNDATEVKFENTINRATAIANPRQIERTIRGTKFNLDLIYELENKEEFLEDINTLAEGMKLIQYDYLGGNGSRGYGKIKFRELVADVVIGEVDNGQLEKCNEILNNVMI